MIKVGGATEIEVKERKDRVDDALWVGKLVSANLTCRTGDVSKHLKQNLTV